MFVCLLSPSTPPPSSLPRPAPPPYTDLWQPRTEADPIAVDIQQRKQDATDSTFSDALWWNHFWSNSTINQCFSYPPSSANVIISTCWSQRVPLLLTSLLSARPSTALISPELRSTCFSLLPSGEQNSALNQISGKRQSSQEQAFNMRRLGSKFKRKF